MEHETVNAPAAVSAFGESSQTDASRTMKKKFKALEHFMNLVFFLCGIVAVAFVLVISIYLVISGLPAIIEIGPINFIFGTRWYASTGDFGIFAIILTSFAGTAGAILIGGAGGADDRHLPFPRWPTPRRPPSSIRRWSCWPAFPRWSTAWWA